ncbi:MAG: hypothetical protein ACYDAY_07550 [Candidatus Dormibacteria bacterium]
MRIQRFVTMGSRRSLAWVAAAVVVCVPALGSTASGGFPPDPPRFITGPLPADPGSGLAHNLDLEPGIAVDGGGTFWVASDLSSAPNRSGDAYDSGLLGADVWKSGTAGFGFVARPFSVAGDTTPGLGGEDTDIAAAPAPGSTGHYGVFVASLWVGATALATSVDGGETWQINDLAGVPVQDRPWIAADNACDVYVSYHQAAFNPVVSLYHPCDGTTQPSSTTDTLQPEVTSTPLQYAAGNTFGKLWVDTSSRSPHRHTVYQPFVQCVAASAQDVVAIQSSSSGCGGGPAQVVVAVSTDQDQTWSDHVVAPIRTGVTPVWPANVTTDSAGAVYVTWHDEHNVFESTSADAGNSWSPPLQVNLPGTAGVYPTIAGLGAGIIQVAWYGTDRAGDANDAKVMGMPNTAGAAPWHTMWSESTDGGRTFWGPFAVGGVVHNGELCTNGSGCSDAGSRGLYDDFGIVGDPVSNRTAIAFGVNPSANASDSYTAMAIPELPQYACGPAVYSLDPVSCSSAQVQGASHGPALPNTSGPAPLAWIWLLLALPLPLAAGLRQSLLSRRHHVDSAQLPLRVPS